VFFERKATKVPLEFFSQVPMRSFKKTLTCPSCVFAPTMFKPESSQVFLVKKQEFPNF